MTSVPSFTAEQLRADEPGMEIGMIGSLADARTHRGAEKPVVALQYTAADFRKALQKIMPGYQWTVHKPLLKDAGYLTATGIQSSGFNRLSTLAVTRRERGEVVLYEAKSAGFGKRAEWLHTNVDYTLPRALRGLQEHYENKAATYRGHAIALQSARAIKATEAA